MQAFSRALLSTGPMQMPHTVLEDSLCFQTSLNLPSASLNHLEDFRDTATLMSRSQLSTLCNTFASTNTTTHKMTLHDIRRVLYIGLYLKIHTATHCMDTDCYLPFDPDIHFLEAAISWHSTRCPLPDVTSDPAFTPRTSNFTGQVCTGGPRL